MKRRMVLTEMMVAVAVACALLAWVFAGSHAWLTDLSARLKAQQPACRYVVAPLNWGVSARVLDINESGVAVGAATREDGQIYAAMWDDGETIACYPARWDVASKAVAITDDGAVAFNVVGERSDLSRAYVRFPGAPTVCLNEALPGIVQCNVHGMDNDGTAVGMVATAGEIWHAFVWSPERGMEILGGDRNVANDINADGVIAGVAPSNVAGGVPCVWAPTASGTYVTTGLQTLEGVVGRAYATNAHGVVAGRVREAVPICWSPEAGLTVLPGVDGRATGWARDINDRGEIVGCITGLRGGCAILWRDGKAHDLNDCIPRLNGWHLVEATAINNAGMIGCRMIVDECSSPVLLEPVS